MSIKSRLDPNHMNLYDGYFHIEIVDYPINSESGPIIYRTKDYFKNEINEVFVKDIFEESFINSQKGTMANLLGVFDGRKRAYFSESIELSLAEFIKRNETDYTILYECELLPNAGDRIHLIKEGNEKELFAKIHNGEYIDLNEIEYLHSKLNEVNNDCAANLKLTKNRFSEFASDRDCIRGVLFSSHKKGYEKQQNIMLFDSRCVEIRNVYFVRKDESLFKLNDNEINKFSIFDMNNLKISYDYSHAFDNTLN